MIKNVVKLIGINVFFLIIGLIFLEFSTRIYLMITNKMELSFLRNPPLIIMDKYRSIIEYSPTLGYVPIKNIHFKVDLQNWNSSILTINELGFRKGIEKSIDKNNPILIAGDSFVFGNQVNDDETWPAYLQKAGYNIYNLGVGGYGTAQSLLRLKTFIDEYNITPKLVILQTLVGFDFIRDTYDFYSGFPSTALYKNENNIIKYFCPSKNDLDIIGSKYSSVQTNKNIFITLSEYSHFIRLLFTKQIQGYQKRLDRTYKDALSKEEIIDFVLTEFSKMPYKKIFLLQYGGDENEIISEEKKYLLSKLKKLGIEYIDTYNATRINNKPIKELYFYHHTSKGNEVIANYILNTKLLD
ncbi:hypothetical protein CP985_03515 [Malaciobacter mytili LMG 24559]|uniref:SGNH/GDSL hydrolase family protein n=2 Tax=Malaciobacter mytili TaxID=603050 RepID=A0AAX2AI30_9BACT|nr:hypothetical protein AMYT_2268 [Malaciobacter mytili LMG 24559]RXK16379.1 hypothetical protein CP985_03515 [Malaciobacter mytili LMG 24559]